MLFTKEPVRVTIAAPDMEQVELNEEYRRVATKIGAKAPPQITAAIAVQTFLHNEGQMIYPLGDVERYMTRLAQKLEMNWGWFFVSGNMMASGESRDSIGHQYGRVLTSRYEKAIPYPVLRTIETLMDAAAETDINLGFYATDFYERMSIRRNEGDPFLAVAAPAGKELFVIERWDEPGFRF